MIDALKFIIAFNQPRLFFFCIKIRMLNCFYKHEQTLGTFSHLEEQTTRKYRRNENQLYRHFSSYKKEIVPKSEHEIPWSTFKSNITF
jgi:hypothetical protein